MFNLLSVIVAFARVSVIWSKNPLTRKIFMTLSQVALTSIILLKNERKNRAANGKAITGGPDDKGVPANTDERL